MDSFCNVVLNKRFIKCISKKDDTCYLFTGKIPLIKSIITKIKKNKKNDSLETDSLENVSDSEIQELYDYLGGSNGKNITIDIKKKAINEVMFLDKYSSDKLIFVNESINEDDTNEIILHKIIYNCYKDKTLSAPYIYTWYVDGNTNQNTPIQFK
jgi:glycerol-3-phosphate responsive antiterminator